MTQDFLAPDEQALWHAWKIAGEAVLAHVTRELAEATGLSVPDFGVLSWLVDLGDGELRQQALADAMRWEKSRLSHQLTRMQQRGLVQRHPAHGRGVRVAITRTGREMLACARPVHARAIRAYLLDRVGPEQRQLLAEICADLTRD